MISFLEKNGIRSFDELASFSHDHSSEYNRLADKYNSYGTQIKKVMVKIEAYDKLKPYLNVFRKSESLKGIAKWKSLIITRLMKHVSIAMKFTRRRKNRSMFGNHTESIVIRRDDSVFFLRSLFATSRCSVLDNQELIENHLILPYYDGEKICSWKEL